MFIAHTAKMLFFQTWAEFQRDERKILLIPSSDSQEGPKCFVFRVFIGTRAGTWSRADGKPPHEYLLRKLSVNKTKYT